MTDLVETINGAAYTTAYTLDADQWVSAITMGGVAVTAGYDYDGLGRIGTRTTTLPPRGRP